MKCTRCEATVEETWICESCGTSDLCFSDDEEIIACLHGYRGTSGVVRRLCQMCREVGKELCTLRGIPKHVLCEEREGLLGRYYCACCPLSEKRLPGHKYVPVRLCPDIGLPHRTQQCGLSGHPYCDRCPFGCGCGFDCRPDWHVILVSFKPPSQSVRDEIRSRWATWARAFSSSSTTMAKDRRAFDVWPASQLETDWMGLAPSPERGCFLRDRIEDGCFHLIRACNSSMAGRLAVADHRRALDIQAWEGALDYSDARCVHHHGKGKGRDPRHAERKRLTLLDLCLRRVAPLWTRMPPREKRVIPVELAEKVVALRRC